MGGKWRQGNGVIDEMLGDIYMEEVLPLLFWFGAGRIVNEYELSHLEKLMGSIFLFKFWWPLFAFFFNWKLKNRWWGGVLSWRLKGHCWHNFLTKNMVSLWSWHSVLNQNIKTTSNFINAQMGLEYQIYQSLLSLPFALIFQSCVHGIWYTWRIGNWLFLEEDLPYFLRENSCLLIISYGWGANKKEMMEPSR